MTFLALAHQKCPRTVGAMTVMPRPEHIDALYKQDREEGRTKHLLDEPALMQWQHWRLIENRYPYANWFAVHHMLIPISGAAHRSALEPVELAELHHILYEWATERYHQFFENLATLRSVKDLLHLHLVVLHGYPAPSEVQ